MTGLGRSTAASTAQSIEAAVCAAPSWHLPSEVNRCMLSLTSDRLQTLPSVPGAERSVYMVAMDHQCYVTGSRRASLIAPALYLVLPPLCFDIAKTIILASGLPMLPAATWACGRYIGYST